MYKKIYPTRISNTETAVVVQCPFCGKTSALKLKTSDWEKGVDAVKHGANIQIAYPKLSADERELLISGICNDCWQKI